MNVIEITEDGVYPLGQAYGATSSVVYVDLASGSLTLGYTNPGGTFVPFPDGALANGEQYTLTHGYRAPVGVQAVGASGSSVSVYKAS